MNSLPPTVHIISKDSIQAGDVTLARTTVYLKKLSFKKVILVKSQLTTDLNINFVSSYKEIGCESETSAVCS